MQLNSVQNQEIVIGGGKQMMFGIDSDTPIIFDILRNKMYSNKIAAVAREVASNSRDANRESGTDKPVEIEFTDNSVWMAGNLSLIFRDNGIGISPDRIEKIFLKYGASTKRGDNVQTGGFGLGAKTPFAYTDSFIVHTINDEIEYVYSAIIDATGKGKMILVYEDFTDKPSGTEIIIPIVSHEDRGRFEDEIYRATMYWDNVEYINFKKEKPTVTYVMEGESYKLTKYNGWANFVGLLDGIPYEIRPTGKLPIPGYSVMLDLEVGEVTINANRETLQYDEKTTEYINAKYEAFIKELESKVQAYLSDNATYRDAYLKYSNFRKKHVNRTWFEQFVYDLKESGITNINFDVHFNGEAISYLRFKFHTIEEANYDDWKKKTEWKSSPLDIHKQIVYFDKGRISVAKNEELGNFILIKPIKGNPESEIKAEIDKLNELTDGNYLLYSEVKVENEKIIAKAVKRDYLTIKVRDENRFSAEIHFDKISKKVKNIDNVLFLPVITIRRPARVNSDKLTILKYLTPGTRVFSIGYEQFNTHFRPNGYKTFDEAFKEVDLTQFSSIVEANKIDSTIGEVHRVIRDNFPEILPKSFAELKDKASKVPAQLQRVSWSLLDIPKSSFNYQGLVKKYHKVMEEKYPMLLPYLRHGYENEERKLKVAKQYIESVR